MQETLVKTTAVFVPTLYVKDLAAALSFYKRAFNATELWHINHEGRIHVAEMSIGPVTFRMHEESLNKLELSPFTLHGTSIVLGLLTPDPDELAARAELAGATILSPVQDYDYGYRQGTIRDPFGHHWCLEGIDSLNKIPVGAR